MEATQTPSPPGFESGFPGLHDLRQTMNDTLNNPECQYQGQY